MRTLVALATIGVILSASFANAQDWTALGFRESRFAFEAPPGFEMVQEAVSGQGAAFERDDGAYLAVWGVDLPRGEFRAQIASQMEQDEAEGWELTYRRVTSNWASYSGIKDGKIRYFRSIVVCGGKAAAFVLDYDRADKIPFDPIVVRMVRTFRADGCPA